MRLSFLFFFFFNDTATTEIYTLSLHDALPIFASLTSLFGAVGLVLAAVGLYGVTAYGVEQRTTEIGVRMALGASQRSVVGLVLRGALMQAVVGILVGVPIAIVAGNLLGSALYDVAPWDALLLGAAGGLFVCVALIAGAIPAWRAGRVTAMRALRAE